MKRLSNHHSYGLLQSSIPGWVTRESCFYSKHHASKQLNQGRTTVITLTFNQSIHQSLSQSVSQSVSQSMIIIASVLFHLTSVEWWFQKYRVDPPLSQTLKKSGKLFQRASIGDSRRGGSNFHTFKNRTELW